MKRVVSFEFTQLVTTVTFSQFEINHMIKWSTCANQTKCRSPRPTIPILARYLELASKGVAVDSTSVPNRRAGPNKRAGGKIKEKE